MKHEKEVLMKSLLLGVAGCLSLAFEKEAIAQWRGYGGWGMGPGMMGGGMMGSDAFCQ
jgi:hypothetical protein